MFRWTVPSGRAIAGTLALLGCSISAFADQPAPGSAPLPSTSLGQPAPVPKSKTTKPTAPPTGAAPAQPAPALPQPAPAVGQTQESVPPAPAPALPGLGALMTPNGIALPGGVGFIRPGADTVGVQINTPTGPIEFTVPRRRRGARNVQEPPTPQATTDAPLFGQPGKPAPSPGPQASVPGAPIENDRTLPGELTPPGAGRPSRGTREFAHASRLFHARNLPLVLRRLDRALIREPGDRDLLQLRSLTHLTLGDYKSAYADAIVALAQDDVWDWSTLRSLYHSADEYTANYRALEDRVTANPNAAELRMLLAYHNLMLGHRDAARRHFERVLALDPSNDVARRFVVAEQPPLPREAGQGSPSPGTSGPALTPIPARKRSTGSNTPGTGGPSIELGEPAPAPATLPVPQKPGG
jgi:hypothetical protein